MHKVFGVKVEQGRKGNNGQLSVGPVYRNPLAQPAFPPADPHASTAWDIFRESAEKHAGNRMLGWREQLPGTTKWGPYVWKTYQQVYDEIMCVASALAAHNIQPGSRVGIYGSNCPQWIVAMQACNAQSLICVPLYDTLGPGAVDFIIDHAEIDCVFVQHEKLKQLLSSECTHAERLKLIVCFTSLPEGEKNTATSLGAKPYSWNDFLQMGKENPCELTPPQPSSICTIMYTSGTSGNPKGVILTHQNIATAARGVDLFMEQFEDKMTVDDVYISFLPLAHVLDRMIEEYFFHKGASVGYYHGDINEIRDDLVELRPTFLAGVPRVFERIHEGVLKALQELNPRRRKIFDILYNYKLSWMKSGYKQRNASWLADLLAFRKVKNRLGGRLRLIVSGAAPLSTEIEEFLRVTTCAFVVQGYGLTESCGLASLGFPDEMSLIGTVGSPFVYTEVRLEEVPEMGYDPLGDPSRGEICIRGDSVFSGYYKNPELTRESIVDGWFHTGDIGEISSNGVVKIIDRKKNIIKLSQGEYVAVEHLENVYTMTPIVEDVWVYGDSYKSSVVAVVVPNVDNTAKWGEKNGYKEAYSSLCCLKELQEYVLQELRLTALRNKLRGFEYIKGVILETKPFETLTDLVTPTLKKKRDKLLKHYKVEIDGVYSNLQAAHKKKVERL